MKTAALIIFALINVACATQFYSSYQGAHGVYAWNETITGGIIEQQYQLAAGTKICGKVYYLKGDDAESGICYLNAGNTLTCYDDEKECLAATTWVTGADSDDRVMLAALTVTGKTCTKNYWRKTKDDSAQSLYCFTTAAGSPQCYDDKKECVVANNATARATVDQINLGQITVDNQLCYKNYYLKGDDSTAAYCWNHTKGQQCWIDKEKCLSDVELQVAAARRTVDNFSLSSLGSSLNPMNLVGGGSNNNNNRGNNNGGVMSSVTNMMGLGGNNRNGAYQHEPTNNGSAWDVRGYTNPNTLGTGSGSSSFLSGLVNGGSQQNGSWWERAKNKGKQAVVKQLFGDKLGALGGLFGKKSKKAKVARNLRSALSLIEDHQLDN